MKIIADENIVLAAECFSTIGEVETVAGREITPPVVRKADVLIVRSITQVNSDLLSASNVRFVGTATIGVEHVDVDFLKDSNIGFASAKRANANSVAEYVIAAMLSVAKQHEIQLEGKSIGIIGAGNIGSKVEEKARALAMNVLLNDPPLQRKRTDAKYLPLKELFGCDFLTLHTPLTFEGQDKTFHLADEKFFKSLKPGCVFLNTSRGAVVDTKALKNAIKAKILKGTVLDVWEDEPAIDTELLEMVDIGTPHIAGYSLDGKIAGLLMIYKEVCSYFGLEGNFQKETFLRQQEAEQLTIKTRAGDEQNVLREAIEKVYDIKADDRRMREILNMPMGKRCGLFDRLRRDYPVRREFQNTRIVVDGECKGLAEKLAGIGFKDITVKNEQQG